MLKAVGFNELITVNIHQEKTLNIFPFPAKNLSAVSLLSQHLKKEYNKAFVLAPDIGAMYIAKEASKVLGGDCGYLEKYRDRFSGQIKVKKKSFNVRDKTVIIFDDIISTGGTIVSAAKILKELGVKNIYAACIHPLLIGDAENRILKAGVKEIIGTDSVPNRFSKVSLASLLSEELKVYT
jgi:ribose-phosphate pyrophosphokinase